MAACLVPAPPGYGLGKNKSSHLAPSFRQSSADSQSRNPQCNSATPGNGPARIDQEAPIPGGIESAEEERRLRNLNSWICSYGLPEGELSYELTDAATGRPIALLDLAWPNGLRMGLSGPVAVLIDEGQDLLRLANAQGYMYFTDIDRFKAYVEREVLATVGTEAAGSTMGG
jgi:hypothetical protein